MLKNKPAIQFIPKSKFSEYHFSFPVTEFCYFRFENQICRALQAWAKLTQAVIGGLFKLHLHGLFVKS
jgi:hypothetical protein